MITVEYFVTCDRCRHHGWDSDNWSGGDTEQEARANAERNDWAVIEGQDICPGCQDILRKLAELMLVKTKALHNQQLAIEWDAYVNATRGSD
jgi:hypothetical protein